MRPSRNTSPERPLSYEALCSRRFWQCYNALPRAVQALADKNFRLLRETPNHPLLNFKKVRRFRSARVGLHYRTLAVEVDDGLLWFWIGSHADYDRLIET